MYGPPIAFGYEKVLASLDTSDYAVLGRLGELKGNYRSIPWVSSTYNDSANKPDSIITKIVQNVSGGSLAAGSVVVRDATSGSYIHGIGTTTTVDVQRQKLAGILIGDTEFGGADSAPTAIADDSICDIMLKGLYRVRCASGVAAGDRLGTSGTAGVAAATTTADAAFGQALTAAASDGSGGYYCYALVNFIES